MNARSVQLYSSCGACRGAGATFAGSISDRSVEQTVIVTGGTDGIGAVIARRFLAGGYRVHICDNRAEPLDGMLAAHLELRGSVADVGDPSDVARYSLTHAGCAIWACWRTMSA